MVDREKFIKEAENYIKDTYPEMRIKSDDREEKIQGLIKKFD